MRPLNKKQANYYSLCKQACKHEMKTDREFREDVKDLKKTEQVKQLKKGLKLRDLKMWATLFESAELEESWSTDVREEV